MNKRLPDVIRSILNTIFFNDWFTYIQTESLQSKCIF